MIRESIFRDLIGSERVDLCRKSLEAKILRKRMSLDRRRRTFWESHWPPEAEILRKHIRRTRFFKENALSHWPGRKWENTLSHWPPVAKILRNALSHWPLEAKILVLNSKNFDQIVLPPRFVVKIFEGGMTSLGSDSANGKSFRAH